VIGTKFEHATARLCAKESAVLLRRLLQAVRDELRADNTDNENSGAA